MPPLRPRLHARLHEERERLRIRLHLRRVERALRRARPPDPRRAATLDELRRYWLAGRFPENRARPGRVPVFQDARGHLCAVGHLAAARGRRDLVDLVRASDVHVRLGALAGGPVVAWLPQAGLTQEEAARIQPTYDFQEPSPIVDKAPAPMTPGAAVDTLLAGGALAAVLLANLAIVVAYTLAARGKLSLLAARVAAGSFAALAGGALAVGVAAGAGASTRELGLLVAAASVLGLATLVVVAVGARRLAHAATLSGADA